MGTECLHETVQLAAAGDADALQRLIIHYHAALRARLAAAINADIQRRLDPEDVLQETYAAVYSELAGVDRPHFDSPAAFYGWLERIALRDLADLRRRQRRRKRDIRREISPGAAPRAAGDSIHDLFQTIAADDPTPSRALRQEEAAAAVLSSLARLSKDQRAVIRLRFLEQRPAAEVAARLGKSEDAVHALCYRGLRALREVLSGATLWLSAAR